MKNTLAYYAKEKNTVVKKFVGPTFGSDLKAFPANTFKWKTLDQIAEKYSASKARLHVRF